MANAVTLPGERLAGLSADLFHKLQAGSITLDQLALFTQHKDPFAKNRSLIINYRNTLEQMISAGAYDWTNNDIVPGRFPIVGESTEEYEFILVHPDCDISSEDAMKHIENHDRGNPWMPAKIEHLLAFGKQFPDEQRKYQIVAPDSVASVNGGLRAPYLDVCGTRRGLSLGWWDGRWRRHSRFLAVRKISVS